MTFKKLLSSVLYGVVQALKKNKIKETMSNKENMRRKIEEFLDRKNLFFIFEDIHQEMPPDPFAYARWQHCLIQYEDELHLLENQRKSFIHLMRWHSHEDRLIDRIDIFVDLLSTVHMLDGNMNYEHWLEKLGNPNPDAVDDSFFLSELRHIDNLREFLGDEDMDQLNASIMPFFNS